MNYDILLKYTSELLRGCDRLELENFQRQAQKKLYEMREQYSLGGRVMVVPKPHLFKKVTRDIARIKTILAEKGW